MFFQGHIVWKNSNRLPLKSRVQKSAINKWDVDDIDFKVTVDETNKVIKIMSDVRAPDGRIRGVTCLSEQTTSGYPGPLLELYLYRITPSPHALLGMVAMVLLLLGYSCTSADIQDDIRADVTKTFQGNCSFWKG